jgi:signal transduction histidine kinase
MTQSAVGFGASQGSLSPQPGASSTENAAERLAEVAAREDDDGALLSAAAEVLWEALGAQRVAAFRVMDAPRGHEAGEGRQLIRVGGAGEEDAMPSDLERRLRAAARASMRRHGTVVAYLARTHAYLPPSRIVALAVGAATSPMAFAVTVHEDAAEEVAAALDALRPALGTVAHTAGLRLDLERAERRHSQLQAVFTHSSEAILTVDRGFTILESNPALSSLLDWHGDAPIGQQCSNVLACHDERGQPLCGTATCPLAQAFVLTNSAPYREVTWHTASGKSKEVSASFAAMPSPEGVRGVIIARDMTPVNAANRMRSNFISMVSHELRNPLNSINGFLEIVLEGHVGTLTTRQEEFLEYAHMSTHQLMTLVEDILFISRSDTGQFKLRIAAVSLSELTAQLMMQFRPVAERAQVDLASAIPDDLPTVHVDQLRIQQVISNLLNNAIKFTPPGGSVIARARVVADAILVEVRDSGQGIPSEDHERIFERFYQSGANTLTQAGGYGLGLAIAKLIVQQHGGRIWVASAPGSGSTFSFTIPIDSYPIDEAGMSD